MLYIDIMSRTPVYEQIINQMERLITAGLLKEGEQLPSVRALSLELSVNPNTIQKAYGELDAKGIIGSVPGRGCYVLTGACYILRNIARERLSEIKTIAKDLMAAGVTKEEIICAIDESCEKEETK